MSTARYALVELTGRDPDDWPQLAPDEGRRFEQELNQAESDDLVDAVDLDGEHFFVHAREVKRVTYW